MSSTSLEWIHIFASCVMHRLLRIFVKPSLMTSIDQQDVVESVHVLQTVRTCALLLL